MAEEVTDGCSVDDDITVMDNEREGNTVTKAEKAPVRKEDIVADTYL